MPRSVKADILYPFATLSLIAVVLVGAALAFLVGHEIETRMRDNAAAATADSVTAVLKPQLDGLDLQTPLSGPPYDGLQQQVSRYVLSGETLRLRIYNREGVAVYSSEPSEMGRVLADAGALSAAFDDKTTGTTSNEGEVRRWRRRQRRAASQGVRAALLLDQQSRLPPPSKSTGTTRLRLRASPPHNDSCT